MIDKVKVARSFSRSASTYDSVAYFQRDMGKALLSLMSEAKIAAPPAVCMDLGCGTGYFHSLLKTAFPDSTYLGIDIAEGMLRFAQDHSVGNDVNASLLCADAERIPLADDSVNVAFSNMALQWCEDLPSLFGELKRILPPGSIFGFTTLGPGTLSELKQSWKKVDDLVHVNNFADSAEWQGAILQSDFSIELHRHQNVILKYSSVKTLLRELKLLGAHNINDGQRQTLTGRKRLESLLAAYEAFFIDGYYPATYDVDFWVVRKK